MPGKRLLIKMIIYHTLSEILTHNFILILKQLLYHIIRFFPLPAIGYTFSLFSMYMLGRVRFFLFVFL